jgi:4-alpha-glucanotransferase
MQDFLNLGNEARMNYPGNPSGNWAWRMKEADLSKDLAERIKEFNFLFSRDKSFSTKPKLAVEEIDYQTV